MNADAKIVTFSDDEVRHKRSRFHAMKCHACFLAQRTTNLSLWPFIVFFRVVFADHFVASAMGGIAPSAVHNTDV